MRFLRLELEVESLWEPVQLDLALGEEPVGWWGCLARCKGEGGGKFPLGKMTSKISSLQHWELVGGVEWVDKRRLRNSIIIILILILLGLSNLILQFCLGRGLSSTGDVSSFKDPNKKKMMMMMMDNGVLTLLPESVDPSRVLHGDGLASVVYVAVLPNPLVVPG